MDMDELPVLMAAQPVEIAKRAGHAHALQPKIDGHRIIIDHRGTKPRILNRKGGTYGAGPFSAPIPSALYRHRMVVDGEYVPSLGTYFAFDCLYSGRQLMTRSLHDRYATLRDNLQLCDGVRFFNDITRDAKNNFFLIPVNWHENEINSLRQWFPHVDGMVYKLVGSSYTPGETRDWKKFKFVYDLDAVVTGLNLEGKSNAELSVFDPLTEKYFVVGKASTSGKGKIQLGDVVQVRFLQFTAAGRLREPRIMEIRDDKDATECTVAQLIPFIQRDPSVDSPSPDN